MLYKNSHFHLKTLTNLFKKIILSIRNSLFLFVIFSLITLPSAAEDNSNEFDNPFNYGHEGKFILQPSVGVNNIIEPVVNLGIGYAPGNTSQFFLEVGGIIPTPSEIYINGQIQKTKFGDERSITNAIIANYVIRPEYRLKLVLGLGAGIAINRNWSRQIEQGNEIIVFEEGIAPLVFVSANLMFEISKFAGVFLEVRGGIIKMDIYFPMLIGTQFRF